VGAVDAFECEGLSLWFNSNDHLPPHLHAERPGAWEVRVHFLRERREMFDVVWSTLKNSPGKAELRPLAEL
jgi:hypothetical protein